MRVFYDRNVLLSLFLWAGAALDTHETLVSRGFVPVTSERVVAELLADLDRKFPSVAAAREDIEQSIRANWDVVSASETEASVRLRDATDERILADAESAGVDVLLTGDRDLLDVAEQIRTLKVLSLREVRRRLGMA